MICYLIRHGQDDDTVRGGWAESSLTDDGKNQVKELAKGLSLSKEYNIKKVYTSDLVRAVETAKPLAEALGVPVIPMVQFREVNNGDLAGMDNQKALKCYPNLFWNTLRWTEHYPNGESPKEFYDRIFKAWKSFEIQMVEQSEDVALVTHAGVITVILEVLQGNQYSNKNKYEKIPCTSIIPIECINGQWERMS